MPSHWRLQRPGQQLGAGLRVLIALTHHPDKSDFIVLNDGSFTRIPDRSDQRPSAIYLTLVTPDTAPVVRSGKQVRVLCRPTTCPSQSASSSQQRRRLLLPSASTTTTWPTGACSDAFLGTAEINVGDADLDEVNRRIVSSILETAREAIPVTGGGLSRLNSNPWWNKECEEAVRLKRVMYRHYSKDQNAETHERMKAANRDCNKIIAQAKKDHWIAFADSISAGKADLGSVWKIRRMKQPCVVPDADLQHGSTKYTTAQSKADALAKAFAEASDTDSLPADRQQIQREMEATFTHPTDLHRAKTSLGFHQESQSLHWCGHRLVSDAERGPRVVSEDPAGFLPKMLGWGHNSRGVETRHCRPHPQTRQTEEGARQLQTHLPDIPPREGVRTGDQEPTRIPLWVKENVPRVPGRFSTGTGCHRPPGETGWARREGNREEKGPTVVLLWHLPCLRPGLACQAATETRQDRNFWQHVQLHQILPERQIDTGQMEVSHVDHQRSKYGRSSGICDRPLLFNIMVHDVGTAVKGKVVLTMYADDLAIWTDTHIRRLHTNSSYVKQSMKLFQEAVDGVVHFMQVNGFALSSQKTVFVPFHTNTSQNTEVHIRVNGQSIFASKEVKYLGVHFTRWGRTSQQFAHNARNASRALNVIKVLSAQPWANTPSILVNVVRALVRSRLSYGLEAMPHLSKTGLARLTATEVRGLRLALGLPQSVPQCLVYREAGLLPFRRHIQLVCSKYVFRCQTVDNSTVDEITATFRNPSRLQCYSSICDLVCDLVRRAGLDGVEVATRPLHPYPPMAPGTSARWGGHGRAKEGPESTRVSSHS